MEDKCTSISLSLDSSIVGKIDQLRERMRPERGHVSRSALIRQLVLRSLREEDDSATEKQLNQQQ